MIPMAEYNKIVSAYEKEVKRLNNYISLLIEEKHMAQTAYFVAGLTAGFLLSAMFVMWVMK